MEAPLLMCLAFTDEFFLAINERNTAAYTQCAYCIQSGFARNALTASSGALSR